MIDSDMMDDAEGMELDGAEFLLPHEQELRDAVGQVVAALATQNQLLALIAQRLGPKRVVRDQTGRIVGAEPIE